MSVEFKQDKRQKAASCMVITISDTRDKNTDKSGKIILEKLEAAGHRAAEYCIVKDEKEAIHAAVSEGCRREDIRAVITSGGTGIAKRDVTIETIKPLLEKEITGFGELFRMLSYTEDIGSAAVLSRAVAGVAKETAVFAVPGSSGAVKLAMDRLILPELSHIIHEIRK